MYKIVPIPSEKIVTINIPIATLGPLAVATFHDENDNGKLDFNFIGIPKEGTGASNNAASPFGAPKFIDAKVSLSAKNRVEFKILY